MRKILLLTLVTAVASACTNIGPQTIPRDRFDYNEAISASWKEQTLLNIVKTRYADMPLFVEVASVVSGYSLETSISAGINQSTNNVLDDDTVAIGGRSKYTDRPTITYAPITGSQFNRSFMTPIPPRAVLFMTQSGWPIDLIFRLTVDSINGLRSQVLVGASTRAGSKDYYRAIELLQKMQQSGATGMQIRQDDDKGETPLLLFYKEAMSTETERDLQEVSRLLGLEPNLPSAVVKYGRLASNDREIALLTRSMLQLIVLLSSYVDVPAEHIVDGRTVDVQPPSEYSDGQSHQLMSIRSGPEEPQDGFVAVRYKDYWYWIDDSDFESKRVFSFVMILFSLTESGSNVGLPLVTIPAG